MMCYAVVCVRDEREKQGEDGRVRRGVVAIIRGRLYKVSQFIQGIPARISG